MMKIYAIAIAAIIATSTLTIPSLAGLKVLAQVATQLPANIGNMTNPNAPPSTHSNTGDHLPVHTVQDDRFIVTTVTKSGEPPTGPIVIVPPEPGKPGNGTIITPGENITVGNPGNVTVISPGGNITEVPGNVTNVGNDTVIIAPPDRNITETPGNVTVIDPPRPPVANETPAAPCTCNQTNQAPAPIPPVTITPAPGQNVTTLPHPAENATIPQPLPPAENNSGSNQTTNPSGNNETAGFPGAGAGQLPPNNQTGNPGSNETQTGSPSVNATQPEPPHAQQLPAAYNIFPGFHITAVSYNYNGPNSEWLKK